MNGARAIPIVNLPGEFPVFSNIKWIKDWQVREEKEKTGMFFVQVLHGKAILNLTVRP